MGHEITDRDGLFTVRRPAWHNLGRVLADYPTREQAKAIAHPWEPVTEPLYRAVPRIVTQRPDGTPLEVPDLVTVYEPVETHRAVVRSDSGDTLGVISDTLAENLVSNEELYDIAEAIEGEADGSVMFETGGSLKGGAKVWLLIRLRDPLVIPRAEHGGVIPYYALQNAHDGSASFRGQATMTMIVCDNTAQMADLDAQARGTEFVFRHTGNVREKIEDAKFALTGWRDSVQRFRLLSEHLVDVRVTPKHRDLFVERFIPMPPPHTVSERVVANVTEAQDTLRGILNGPTCVGIEDTAYGLVQASVEYLNHYRKARSPESRFQRAYLDRSRIVADAVELAQEVATY